MNEEATGECKGMKWALRLVAPLCLGLVLILAWQECQMAVTAKQVMDSCLGGEPPPGLTALFLLSSFPWAACVIPVALIGYAIWSLEQSSSKIGWSLSLGLAAFLAMALLALAHVSLHHLPFQNGMIDMRTNKAFFVPPPEHECPVCHGWKSWPEKKK